MLTKIMDSSQTFVFNRTVSPKIFEQLCDLWQQMANYTGLKTVLLTQKNLRPEPIRSRDNGDMEQIRLLISPNLNALLLGKLIPSRSLYQIRFTWDSQKIKNLLTEFDLYLSFSIPSQEPIDLLSLISPGAEFDFRSQFFSQLLNIFISENREELILTMMRPHASVCEPIEIALRQQVEQERLLNQVISQIRNSLELPVVLETAVKEVRKFLQVDRLLIYQFMPPDETKHRQKYNYKNGFGKVTYESISSSLVSSVLGLIPEDDCFSYVPHYQEKYRRGTVVAIEDVAKEYSSSFCLAEFLRRHHVLSTLIAPIVVEGRLWGLIIAHQCYHKRQWLESERQFLGHIGEHLAIAIYQAQLYSQVQGQKDSFEKRVVECTQELRDTLAVAQAAHQSKSEFLSNMSHELLTPLTCVIGLAGTLLHWLDNPDSFPLEKQKKFIKSIQDNGKKLKELINDILDYSSLTSGNYQLNIKEFSLYNLAHTVINNFQEEALQKGIDLELDFQVKEDNNSFYADQERVQQILFHLLSNAIKFTPEHGQVILRIWRENNHAFFQVEDTGIGISQEQFPLLFEQFQQLEKSHQRTYGGTGLGLALTKQLVELHRGTIEVESIPENGSLFTVRLPNQANRKLKKTPNLEIEKHPEYNNKTIILISQDDESATLICELLTVNNYQVIWLADSYSGIKQISMLNPSLVIIDQDLPHGNEISKAIKNFPKTQSIKVLALENCLKSVNWPSLVTQGIDDYLLKPITPNLLLDKISFLFSVSIQNT